MLSFTPGFNRVGRQTLFASVTVSTVFLVLRMETVETVGQKSMGMRQSPG